ncbi:MAG TPA: PepSY domain-containing protein [Methylocella sp.]|nr:PepSY domain-containing protein [Methylocella sp.]
MAHSLLLRQPCSMISFVVLLVAVYLGSGAAARTEPQHERVCFSTAETRDKISAHGLSEPFHAMRSTAGRLQADALGVKLCRWSEELVYELSFLRHDGHVVHVFIDAKTGQAIGPKNED